MFGVPDPDNFDFDDAHECPSCGWSGISERRHMYNENEYYCPECGGVVEDTGEGSADVQKAIKRLRRKFDPDDDD